MNAEIVNIGTELLLGHTINSDAAFIARELSALGIDLFHIEVVGDNASRLEYILKTALSRSDIVITSGGLGPTDDDLTREVVSRVMGKNLVKDEKSLLKLREYFGARPIGENQYRQVLVPEGAHVFYNEAGTAPGFAVSYGGKCVISLPGPPNELVSMLEKGVRPWLANFCSGSIWSTLIKTYGIGEGIAAEKLGTLLESDNPTAATYAADGEMFVKVTAKAENKAEAKSLAEPLIQEITHTLGDVVYGRDVPSLEYVAVTELIQRKMKVATAESCTGGMLAQRITDIPGSSQVFGLGFVTYSNEAKSSLLNVPEELLLKYGAVSSQVAISMAMNVRKIANADIGAGITGIAGPGGGTPEKPVGLVYIAIAFENDYRLIRLEPHGMYIGRNFIRRKASSTALDMIRRLLLGLPAAAY